MSFSDSGAANTIGDNHRFFSRFFIKTNSFHPLLFSHVLIRLGHEPWPPSLRHTPLSLVGLAKRVYMYPWIGTYVWRLFRDLGLWKVCTTGLLSSYITTGLMNAAEENALKYIQHAHMGRDVVDEIVSFSDDTAQVRPVTDSPLSSHSSPVERHPSIVWALRSLNNVNDIDAIRPESQEVSDVIDIVCEERSLKLFIHGFCHLLLWRLYGIVITHPFRVVLVRQIAYAAAGGEGAYTWFPQAVRQVYRESGIWGFFQGLAPSLLAEVLVLSSVVNIYRLLRHFLLHDCDAALLNVVRSILWIFHTHYIQEPLLTVADILAVRGSGLTLPTDKLEVASASWHACWDRLVVTGQLLRASSWFFRRCIPSDVVAAINNA